MNEKKEIPKPYSVSSLTAELKATLEAKWTRIYVEAEISGWRLYPSGHAYFTLKDSGAQISCVMFASSLARCKAKAGLKDGAKVPVWGAPRRIGHGHVINKPIVLSNGDWAMAGYMTETWTNSNYACVAGAFAELDAERGTTCYVSADRGATWEKRGTVRGLESDWNESQLVELKDGRLRVFMRATVGYGRMMVADSTDGGRTWTKPFSLPSMDNPNSRFQVTRLKGGRLLFVTHGTPAASCKDNQGRDRLTAYLSEDDGATWLGGLELWHGYASYPDCCQGPDGTIYVTHDHDRGGAAEIWLHRFTERDVLAGRIVSREGKLNLLVSRGMDSAANRSR